MRRSAFKARAGLLVAVVSLAMVMLTAMPAGALPSDQVTLAGSDTTEDVMRDILANPPVAGDYTGVTSILTPPHQTAGGQTVPLDAHCKAAITWGAATAGGQIAAPNGSGAGKNALRDSAATGTDFPSSTYEDSGHNGCVDIARSSGGPAPSTDPAGLQYYAFALDAVSWASTSLSAPASMTQADLIAIYNCTKTDWSDIPGGGKGHIQRVLPQAGSGTRNFFISNMLNGLDPTTVSSPSCPAVIDSSTLAAPDNTIQENDGTQLEETTALKALQQEFILPYSAGKWVYQSVRRGNPKDDIRGGVRIGGITQPSTDTFDPGTPVYHVRWTGSDFLLNNGTVTGGYSRVATGVVQGATTTVLDGVSSGKFVASDIGQTVTGANLVAGTTLTGLGRLQPASGAGNITVGLNTTTVTGPAGSFVAGDVGRSISGGLIKSGTTIASVDSATQVTLSQATNTTGSPSSTITVTIGGNGSYARISQPTGGAATTGDVTLSSGLNRNVTGVLQGTSTSTLTGPAGSFQASDVGKYVQGTGTTNVKDGTTITGFTSDTQVTISLTTKNLAPVTGAVKIGAAVISEFNPNTDPNTPTNASVAPGVRFVWNIVSTGSPIEVYDKALTIVGFDDAIGQGSSRLCTEDPGNPGAGYHQGQIRNNGFLDLPPRTSPGGNDKVTCIKK